MDTVTAARGRAELRAKLDVTLGAIRRAATASWLKGDPLADQLHALAESIEALGAIYEASADTQLEIAEKLRNQADVVAHDAIERVDAGSEGIIAQLAPRLAVVVETTTRARLQHARIRLIMGGAAALVFGLALVSGVAYSAGFAAGRAQGEISGHTISAAMAAGPDAAAAWATLMADNDPVQALAACRTSVSTDTNGRRFCAMPVWLGPPAAPRSEPR